MMRLHRYERAVVLVVMVTLSLTHSGRADEGFIEHSTVVQHSVREWSTPYTLDIPADLSGRRSQGGSSLSYAPYYGQQQPSDLRQACPPRARGAPPIPGCPSQRLGGFPGQAPGAFLPPNVALNRQNLVLPDERRYRLPRARPLLP